MNALVQARKILRSVKAVCNLYFKERIGFHTIWTRPSGVPALADFEILTLVVSALSWKKHNGPIWLYTDQLGAAWIHSLGLGWLYDRIHVILDDIPETIDAKLFWAAGKLYAYKHAPVPAVSIDYDAIIWKKLPVYWFNEVVALHPEPTSWGGYKTAPIQQFFGDTTMNWETDSLNAGVLVFNDEKLKNRYT
jgi:hypothetical protein